MLLDAEGGNQGCNANGQEYQARQHVHYDHEAG